MLWSNDYFCIVKIGEVTTAYVDGGDAEADFTGVDTIEVNQPFECSFQRTRIVEAGRLRAKEPLRRRPRHKETGLAEHERAERTGAAMIVRYRTGEDRR